MTKQQLVTKLFYLSWRSGFNPWGGKTPWRRQWQPTPVLLPGKSHGRRSLVGHSPWSPKESDTIEVTEHTREGWASLMGLVVKNLPDNVGDKRDMGLIPGWGGSPGGGHSKYSCLENPIDCSMPGFPVHHQLPEFTQTHVH